MNTPLTISSEALAIATTHAELAGQSVTQWLTEAINAHAANQTPREEIPFDDGGFPIYAAPARYAA